MGACNRKTSVSADIDRYGLLWGASTYGLERLWNGSHPELSVQTSSLCEGKQTSAALHNQEPELIALDSSPDAEALPEGIALLDNEILALRRSGQVGWVTIGTLHSPF